MEKRASPNKSTSEPVSQTVSQMNIPTRSIIKINERDARNIKYVQKTQNLTIDDLFKQTKQKPAQSECDDTNRTLKRLHDIVKNKSSHASKEEPRRTASPNSSNALQSRKRRLDVRESVDSTVQFYKQIASLMNQDGTENVRAYKK